MAEIILNDQNFEGEVLKSDVPVLVDFWAPWCGPCKMMGPIVDEVAKDMEGKAVKVAKLNVDESSATAEKYNVMSIPTFKIFKGGEVVDEFVGVQSKEEIVKRIEKIIG
ncbi:thioredoxin [Patescibacteria group bacterium]|nr:thioredoxin [Patescibacteria group bacterium]